MAPGKGCRWCNIDVDVLQLPNMRKIVVQKTAKYAKFVGHGLSPESRKPKPPVVSENLQKNWKKLEAVQTVATKAFS